MSQHRRRDVLLDAVGRYLRLVLASHAMGVGLSPADGRNYVRGYVGRVEVRQGLEELHAYANAGGDHASGG